MNEVDARHPPPLPHPSPIPVGKGSASLFGQRDAVYVTLVTLHVHFPTATFSMHSQTKDFDLLQLTEEKRPVNQEGNDTMRTTGESIFHVYIAHLKTSYVDQGKHFWIKL